MSLTAADALASPLTLDELRDFVNTTANWPGDTKLGVKGGGSFGGYDRTVISVGSRRDLP